MCLYLVYHSLPFCDGSNFHLFFLIILDRTLFLSLIFSNNQILILLIFILFHFSGFFIIVFHSYLYNFINSIFFGVMCLEKTGAGRDWGQEEKGMTDDEMVRWHHWLDGREFEWTPGVGDGQGSLACCNSWGHKESDTPERLNWTELNM